MSRARPMCELPAVPDDTRWPPVEVAYIYGADEQVLDPAWIRRACPERLGIEPIVMPGAHSLFLSRPVSSPASWTPSSAAGANKNWSHQEDVRPLMISLLSRLIYPGASRQLTSARSSHAQLVSLGGAGHNDMPRSGKRQWSVVQDFLTAPG